MQTLSRKGTWRTYSPADGLPSLQLEHLAEDAEGYLWIATFNGGACRFDGDQFETFTTADGLPSNRVHYIHLDQQDKLWVVTNAGLCWWDGDAFQRVATGDANTEITFLCEARDGLLFLGGRNFIGFYDREQERFCDLQEPHRFFTPAIGTPQSGS